MERTYRWGYKGIRLTEAELRLRWSWANVHPEMQRRALACANEAQDVGVDLGFGEGARNPEQQLAEFFRRHNQVSSGGCCTWQGKRYALKKGMAPLSPPGYSNHDDDIYEGCAVAIDFVGWENHWFDANCERFGIKNFGGQIGPGVNGEEWHGQPLELPNSRQDVTGYFALGGKLRVWPLPGDPVPPPPTNTGVKDMFFPITPTRMVDTRIWPKVPLNANQDYEFGLNPVIVPANAIASAMNITVIGGAPGSFLKLWGSGPVPETSVANFNAGDVTVNASYIGPISNLKFKLRPNSPMHVVIDVTGYWTH